MNFTYETQRLYLKVLNENFAPAVLDFLYRNREIFEPYETAKPSHYYTEKFQRANLRLEYKAFLKSKYARFFVYKKDDANTIIGTISFSNILYAPFSCGIIGYKFDKQYQGHGYATEAMHCAVSAAFQDSDMHRLTAFVLPDNKRSAHLLKRIGFAYEGICRKSICICGEYKDHCQYAIIDEDIRQWSPALSAHDCPLS